MANDFLALSNKEKLKLFAQYLIQEKLVSLSEVEKVLKFQSQVDLRIGQLALLKGYLIPAQVFGIINLQMKKDRLFGELAIEEGMLTPRQVEKLIDLQNNSFLLFAECIVITQILAKTELSKILRTFMGMPALGDRDKGGDTERRVSANTEVVFKAKSAHRSTAVVRFEIQRLKALVGWPSAAREIMKLLKHGDVHFRKIARLINADPALSEGVKRLLDSGSFTLPGQQALINTQIFTLGSHTLEKLIVMASVMNCFRDTMKQGAHVLWAHGALTGQWARTIATLRGAPPESVEKIFLAGMLHDVGKLAIYQHYPRAVSQIRKRVKKREPEEMAERAVLGMPHSDIGAFISDHWSFPEEMTNAILYHHAMPHGLARMVDSIAVIAVNAGCRLAHAHADLEALEAGEAELDLRRIGDAYLDFIGMPPAHLMQAAPGVLREARKWVGLFSRL